MKRFLVAKSQTAAFAQIDIKNATIYVKDGYTTLARQLEVKVGEGTISYSEKQNVEYTLDRGVLDEVKLGDEVPVDVTMDFVWEYITSGTSLVAAGTVNDADAGYNDDLTTSMVIDTVVGGPVAVGDTFTVADETATPTHTVTEVSSDGLTIVFTPAMVDGGANDAVITGVAGFTSAAVNKGSGGYTTESSMTIDALAVAPGIGEAFTVVGDATGNIHYCLTGCTTTQLHFTPALNGTIADGAAITFLGVPTLEDFMKRTGAGANLTSSDADTCRPYSVDVEIQYVPSCSGSNNTNVNETILLSDYRWETMDHDLRAGTVSSSGRCNITSVTATRSTPS